MDKEIGRKGSRLIRIAPRHVAAPSGAESQGLRTRRFSQIEAGRLNPTVSMLKKVLDGVPMSMSEFFLSIISKSLTAFFFRAEELTEIADGGVSFSAGWCESAQQVDPVAQGVLSTGCWHGQTRDHARGGGVRHRL